MKLVAVTSCPTGIAHSQMGAEGLEQAAEKMGHDIRIEIQGAMGAEDELTSEEIEEADAVIIAADTSVNRDRFEGKPLVKSAVARAINESEELIQEAVEKAGGSVDTGATSEATATEAEAEPVEGEGATETDPTKQESVDTSAPQQDTAETGTSEQESTETGTEPRAEPTPSKQEESSGRKEKTGLLGKLKSLFS